MARVHHDYVELLRDRELWNIPVVDVVIDKIKWAEADRVRKDLGDMPLLTESINRAGLLQPILVTPDGAGYAGYRRWLACKSLGWERIPAHVAPRARFRAIMEIDPNYLANAEVEENTVRKEFTPSELARIHERYLEEEKIAARERQRGGGRRGGSGEAPSNLDEASSGKAFDRACARISIKPTTMRKIKAAWDARDAQPEIIAKMDRDGKVDGPYKELCRLQQLEQVHDVPPPTGHYRTIVIDPPWPVDKMHPSEGEYPLLAYPLMTLPEIEAKVGEILEQCAEKSGCHIYLWTTHSMLAEAFKLFEAWGVTYKSRLLSWEKVDAEGKPLGGNPNMSFRPMTEFVLFGGFGSLPLKHVAIRSHFKGLRREHSRKPSEFYEIVEEASPGPYLDVFGRGGRGSDWTSWGLEATKFDEEPVPAPAR